LWRFHFDADIKLLGLFKNHGRLRLHRIFGSEFAHGQ
jgi:hypothetical protein